MRGNTIIIIIFIHLQQERERENNKEIVFYCIAPPVAGAPDPEMNEFFVLLFYSCPVDSLVLINRVLEMRAKRSKKKNNTGNACNFSSFCWRCAGWKMFSFCRMDASRLFFCFCSCFADRICFISQFVSVWVAIGLPWFANGGVR